MSDGWKPARLGDLVSIEHGWPFKSDEFSEDLTGRPIVVAVGNFRYEGGFRFDTTATKEYRGVYPKSYELKPGDTLLIMTCQTQGGEILGVPARIPDDGRTYLHNQRLGKVVVRTPELIDSAFLYHLFRSRDFNSALCASASGSKILHTAPKRIEAYEFLRPPIEIQRAIADVLGSLDDKIEQNRRTGRKLEALARAMFKAWFVDFEPVKAKARGTGFQPVMAAEQRQDAAATRGTSFQPVMGEQRQDAAATFPGMPPEVFAALPARLVNSPLGPVPQGWEVKPLSEVAGFLNGLALQKYPPVGDGTDLPVIKIAELRKGSTEGASMANADIPSAYVIEDGDLLFSWSGTLEVELWFGGRGALNQHLFKVTSQEYPRWLCLHWVRQHLPEFRLIAASKATTMGHIKRGHLDAALVVVPDAATLAAAEDIMEPVYEMVTNLAIESHRLATLRDYLLPRLLSGRVRVREAALEQVESISTMRG